ncbi:MAG TPA: MFS transporter [Armatimonadota bacterium]|jgi:EmrB/QacA subfamily drug resistance transporter
MKTDRALTQDARPVADAVNWIVLAPIGVGAFMSALDSSIVNTILPVLTHRLHADIATIEWVVTVYLLVVSSLLLSVGRWGDLHGQKKVYCIGFSIFVASSALCGMAPSALALIASRGLQAVGASMLFASAPAILTANFPARRRGQVLGLQALMTYLGLTVGPLLGGWLTTHLGWRSVFLVNVPVGLTALALAIRYVPADRLVGRPKRFDAAGAALFMAGLVALMLALNQGSKWGWTSAPVLGLFGFSAITLGAFLRLEGRLAEPMLDLSLFRTRLFSAAAATALLNYVTLYSVLFVLPFYLIQGRGYSPAYAGALLTAQPVVMAITAPLSGLASDYIGTRIPSTLGMAIMAAGIWMLSRLDALSTPHAVVAALAATGLGTGIFVSPNNSALMGSAPRDRQGIASGVLATARNVGMVLGVGMAGAVFTSTQAHWRSGGPSALFHSVQAAFMAAFCAAALGVLTALARGRPAPRAV